MMLIFTYVADARCVTCSCGSWSAREVSETEAATLAQRHQRKHAEEACRLGSTLRLADVRWHSVQHAVEFEHARAIEREHSTVLLSIAGSKLAAEATRWLAAR